MPHVGRLHLITDTRPGLDVLGVVAAGLAGGVDTVQVRVLDETTDREAFELAARVLELCRAQGATCLVNDRLHVALAVGADGGHVGEHDLPVAAARKILGPHAILGATTREPIGAQRAVADGASYLGVGPAYLSSTKTGLPTPLGPAGIAAVAEAVRVPVIAIGGVTASRVGDLLAAGAFGVAVVAAVNDAPSPQAAAEAFTRAIEAGHTQSSMPATEKL